MRAEFLGKNIGFNKKVLAALVFCHSLEMVYSAHTCSMNNPIPGLRDVESSNQTLNSMSFYSYFSLCSFFCGNSDSFGIFSIKLLAKKHSSCRANIWITYHHIIRLPHLLSGSRSEHEHSSVVWLGEKMHISAEDYSKQCSRKCVE